MINQYPTMKKILSPLISLFVFLTFFLHSTIVAGQEITTYYLIRHAEKDLSDKSNRNPHLTEVGQERALAWEKYFKEVDFDAVFSTNYHRTKETATPTAEDHNLPIEAYDPRDLYNAAFKAATQGKTVLVVGHSNTTPFLANKILGEETFTSIDERIHGNLYLLQLFGDHVSCQLLSLE